MYKACQHFPGACSMLIHQHDNPIVEFLSTSPFSHDNDRLVATDKSQCKEWGLPLVLGYPAKLGKFFPAIAFLRSTPREAIPDWDATRRKIAHQPKTSNAAARIASKIHNEPIAVPHLCDRSIDTIRKIDANYTRKHAHFQVTDPGRRFLYRNMLRFGVRAIAVFWPRRG